MRIVELEIEGFRSIRRLHLTGLGPFVVLYGENGAGKSTLLEAIRLFWTLVEALGMGGMVSTPGGESPVIGPDNPLLAQDMHRGDGSATVVLRALVDLGAGVPDLEGRAPTSMDVRFGVRRGARAGTQAFVDRLELSFGDHGSIRWEGGQKPTWTVFPTLSRGDLSAWLRGAFDPWLATFARRAWLAIPALRGGLAPSGVGGFGGTPSARASRLALEGRFAEAAFVATTSPDLDLADRLRVLEEVLGRPPMSRPPFRAVQLEDGRYGLQEIQTYGGRRLGVPLDLAGLGVQQLYAILGAIVLSKAPIVAVEEPEAHLHAPTLGRALRAVLRDLVDRQVIDQLFVATHSSLFDLDSTGYWDVRLDPEQGTVVERRTDLVDIDRHLYEPGPARHALLDALSRTGLDQEVYARPDGSPVTAKEMIRLLTEDDALAVDYLRDVTAAAVRVVRLGSTRRA